MAKIAFDLPVAANTHAVHGRGGADTMLLVLAPPELVVKRYGRLVVGSGDGMFVQRAQIVHDRGVAVDTAMVGVRQWPGCIDRRLVRDRMRKLDRAGS